jgi:S-formylglutathione hydrolase FrmB
MRRISIGLVAGILLGAGLSHAAQIATPNTEVAPAVVVQVPSTSLGTAQAVTILLPSGYAAASSPRYLACGNQDIFVADNRRFVERLTARKIPYEYHELSPFGHSWDLWDPQIVNFMDVISKLWSRSGR